MIMEECDSEQRQNVSRVVLITSIVVDVLDEMQFGHQVIDDSPLCGRFGTCQPADLTGSGRLDIYVAEMGLWEREEGARILHFRLQADGDFKKRLMHRGMTPHELKEIDMNDNGRTDIARKSYRPDHHVDVWYNDG